jgi:uncharacterized protein YdaU (DUF1376 family)
VSKKRWFRLYTDRWFKGTARLSPNEIAAYITILCELYDNDGICELNIDVMAHRCGMRPTSFQKALDALILRKKVCLEAGFLTSKAVEEEIKSREKLVQKSAESRANRAEKRNGNKGKSKKDTSYTEYRTKTLSFLEEGAVASAFEGPQGVEGFLARQAVRKMQ